MSRRVKSVKRTTRHTQIDKAMCAYSIGIMDAGKPFSAAESAAAIRRALPDFTMAELWAVVESRFVYLDGYREELVLLLRYMTLQRENFGDPVAEAMERELGGRPC